MNHYQGYIVDIGLGFTRGQVFDHPWQAELYVLENILWPNSNRRQEAIQGVVRWFQDGKFKAAYKV